jgi:gas vesicle protein
MTTPISKQFRWSDEDINKAIQETKQKVLEIIDERIRLNKRYVEQGQSAIDNELNELKQAIKELEKK